MMKVVWTNEPPMTTTIILEQFADYEPCFLATALQGRIMDKPSVYEVKTVSVSKAPVKTIGGFTVPITA